MQAWAMHLSRWLFNSLLAVAFLFHAPRVCAQQQIELPKVPNTDIACAITLESTEWQPNSPAVIRGVVTNLSDHSAHFTVEPTLLLRSKNPEGDSYWSPVDVFRDVPLPTSTRLIGKGSKKAQVIQARAIPLKFDRGHQEVQFQIDASHLLWEKQISSVWPSQQLFSAVKAGAYSLTLLLGTNHGDCETAKVNVTLSTTPAAK
jgi:hypothetical protein